MTIAETIYQRSLHLPEHAAREALDFIEFLEQRYAATPARADGAQDQAKRKEALARLDGIRIRWGGKPIANRNALYDDFRGV